MPTELMGERQHLGGTCAISRIHSPRPVRVDKLYKKEVKGPLAKSYQDLQPRGVAESATGADSQFPSESPAFSAGFPLRGGPGLMLINKVWKPCYGSEGKSCSLSLKAGSLSLG